MVVIIVKLLIALVFPVLSLTHPPLHHSPCCHANPRVSKQLRTCLSDEIKISHSSFSQRAECESKKEMIFLSPKNELEPASQQSLTLPRSGFPQNNTYDPHSNNKRSSLPMSSAICSCGELSKRCHFSSKCFQKNANDESIALSTTGPLEHICVSKEILIKLARTSGTTCDQILNNIELSEHEKSKSFERPKNIISSFMEKIIKKNNIEEDTLKKKEDIIRSNSTDNNNKYQHIYQTLKMVSTLQGGEGYKDSSTSEINSSTSPHHKLKAASIHRQHTTKQHHLHSTHKQPKTSPAENKQINTPTLNFRAPKQFSLKTKSEFRQFYEWISKHAKLGADGRISDVGELKKWIRVFFDNNKKGPNKTIFEDQEKDHSYSPDLSHSEMDSFGEQLIFNSKYAQKRQAENYNYDRNDGFAGTNEENLPEDTTISTNDSAIYDTFVNRQVLLWFSSLSEPRWIKSHINENAEKFSLYVILFVFLGVISTMGAVIYRLFFQVKTHKNYIIGKKSTEKEKMEDEIEDGNNDENDEDKDKDPLKKEQQDGEEKFNSPGNWRTPESESSTGDDRTLRDDEHGNSSNIERTDSRHVMCTIVSQERSLDEISQVDHRQHDANNNQPADQAPSSPMISSMLQQTSSPPLSAITNRSSSPPQSPILHNPTHHQQPTLPSPPGSFMFEPPPPNDLNPIIIDSSIITVHPPKMNEHDPDDHDVNTLARRSRELY